MPHLNRDASALYFPPDAFGPFRVLHQIGAGSLGPVFRAYEADRDRLVAVKVFRLDLTPERQELLAQALASLVDAGPDHPGISAPIAAAAEAGVVYLAQQYAMGESLDVAIRGGQAVPAADALALLEPLADAIDAAARQGLNHGLLHPRDILIAPEGPVITGFGVARALAQVGIALPARRNYSAPEVAAGGDWDLRADVFALGAIARDLMLGRKIDAAESAGLVEPRDEASGLTRVLESATAGEPARRYPDGRALVDALRSSFEAGTPVTRSLTGVEEPVPPAVSEEVPPVIAESPAGSGNAEERPPEAPAQAESPSESELSARPDDIVESEASLPQWPAEPEFPDTAEVSAPTDETESMFDLAEVLSGEQAGREVPGEDPAAKPQQDSYGAASGEVPPTPYQARPPVPAALTVRRRSGSRTLIILAGLAVLFVGGLAGFLARSTGLPPGSEAVHPPASAGQPVASTPPGRVSGLTAPAAGAPPRSNAARPTASKAPAPTTGLVLVRTRPARATVIVNGQSRGLTPLTLAELPLGSYTIRVERDGYAADERQVRLTEARTRASVVMTLKRQPPPVGGPAGRGSLIVESRPAGAQVIVGGRLVGTAPIAVPDLPAGPVSVRIEQEGYQPWTSTVRIAAGERSRVGASLERSEGK